MKNNEIFYFDVDGTLLDNTTHTVPQSTVDALYLLKEKGYLVALCTGRSLLGIHEAGVDDIFPWDGYVLSNGSLILDSKQQVISEIFFEPEFIHELIEVNKGPLLLEGARNTLTSKANKRLLESLKHFGIPAEYPVVSYQNEKIYNLISYDIDTLSKDDYNRLIGDKNTAFDQLGNLEVIPTQGGKYNGLITLNQHLNVSRYVGFGDGDNDVDFLKNANYSVALGNACDSAKEVADFITRDVDQDGIMYALQYHGVL
ncbi:HAD-IIB family hydrolase [Erysipelothrix rhusiopathiae]|nr:HAD-IIB family hydrolase [Erysipelothrix rhusiopathiae]